MGTGTPSCLLLLVPLLGLFCAHGSMAAADPGEKHQQLPGAMVVGTVYCDTCFHQQFSKTSHFISGAVVAVECGAGKDTAAAMKSGFRQEARTNRHGVFRVHLPLSVGKHLRSIQACSVKLVSSGEPFCSVAASATSPAPPLRLRSKNKKSGVHVFSAGFFTFKPLQQPELCYQKPSPAAGSPQLGSSKTFAPFPKLPLPALPLLPPLPQLPALPALPQLPALPNLPSSPNLPSFLPPSPVAPAMDQKQDRPEFLQPPPSTPSFGGLPSPSRPFQPPSSQLPDTFQSPPSLLPSLPFQPPPPSSFSLTLPKPTVPPSSPLPGFSFPSFPFPSFPFFPGVPPAVPSTGGVGAAPPP